MKPLIAARKTSALAATASLLTASAALAHPGEHAAMTVSDAVSHFLASPFHVAGLAVVFAIVAFAVHKARIPAKIRAKKKTGSGRD